MLQQSVSLRVRQLARHIRFNKARGHGIDGNATRREFLGQGLGKTDDARLRGRVIRLPHIPHETDN